MSVIVAPTTMRALAYLRPLCTSALLFGAAETLGAKTITVAEYFIDADPGQGLGTPFAVSSPGVAINQAVQVPAATIAALPDGPHLLVCRLRDDEGVWSVAFARGFHKSNPLPEAQLSVSKIEYRWFQNGAPVSPAIPLTPPARRTRRREH